MTHLLSDLRFAGRLLAKSPGFTATALLSLALALGANSAIFSLVSAAILQPVVPEQPGEVVSVFSMRQDAQREYRRFSFAEFQTLRRADEVFASVAAVAKAQAGVSTMREEGLNRSLIHLTSENYFSLLGTSPAQGRFFTAEEARPNANLPVAVVSHAAWQRLGGAADFLGSTLWINGLACTVVGITREEFNGGSMLVSPEVWLPLGMFSQIGSAFGRTGGRPDLFETGNHALMLAAQLPPGLSVQTAESGLSAIARQLTELDASTPAGVGRELQIAPLARMGITSEPIDESELTFLFVPLIFMAGCVLLIASLNLANMLFARGTQRAKEIAVRIALGASRARIVQQLLIEGLVLSLLGGALGLAISYWTNTAMISTLAEAMRGISNVTLTFQPELNLNVVALTFVACVVATLLFGLAPALRASRLDVVTDIKSNGVSPAGAGKWNRFFAVRNVLVMGQVALSLVLLFSACLFLRGALKAGDIPLGFEASDGLVTEMDYSLRNITPADAQRNLATVIEHVNALPGVARAAVSTQAPMSNSEIDRRVLPAGAPMEVAGATTGAPPGTLALFSGITPGYFETLSVPILRGRDFTEVESRDALAPRVVIIDASLARRLFPAGDALGQRIRLVGEDSVEMEIVGIVGEHRHEFLQVEPTYRLFVPLVHGYSGRVFLQTRLRDAGGPAVIGSVATLRRELRRVNPDLPVLKHEPFNVFINRDASLWSARLGAVVFGLFGAVALLLSVMGVYSVKAYAVAGRTREIGIRCALGAKPSDIIGLVMGQGARQIAVACGVGFVLALLVGQALTSLLFHISPSDPLALAGATIVLVVPALVASYIPARRALQIDPNEALRSE